MTLNKLKLIARLSMDWVAFICKTYIASVPFVILVCQTVGQPVPANSPDSYFWFLECGYAISFLVLLVDSQNKKIKNDRAGRRSAFLFAILALFLMMVFSLALVPHQSK